jgi:hypothetical protein
MPISAGVLIGQAACGHTGLGALFPNDRPGRNTQRSRRPPLSLSKAPFASIATPLSSGSLGLDSCECPMVSLDPACNKPKTASDQALDGRPQTVRKNSEISKDFR